MSEQELKKYLDRHLAMIHVPSFADSDPVQFPRRFSRLQDIEIAAFTVATIAWGRRAMILRDAERMLSVWGGKPYDYVMNEGYRALGTANVHRTFFEPDLAYMLKGFRHIYLTHDSIDSYLKRSGAGQSDSPAWAAAEALQRAMSEANGGVTNSRCLPSNLTQTALKRINMALRWLVRDDGIVDLGVWKCIRPDQLFIPLDVHVGNTARRLGLLRRTANDRKAVEELTDRLRCFCREDPVKYDFALFGIGVNGL
ncbi:MAG: TIGR02757 family protein [Tannerella sp.]|jgi:uncharacterized protein (TIGR02757 family)|nr:TIGR02757 family protein [Tannerella sp.]